LEKENSGGGDVYSTAQTGSLTCDNDDEHPAPTALAYHRHRAPSLTLLLSFYFAISF
jgi:hypothetical protein